MSNLNIKNISLSFGGVNALKDVSFKVEEGELHSIVGPNGSGKTSLLNSISGFYRPNEGEILLDGENLLKLPSHIIATRGVGRTFQHSELFKASSVLDNIKLGSHIHYEKGLLSNLLYWGKTRKEEIAVRKKLEMEIIDLLELESVRNEPVGSLPYGVQKRVDLARALALKPKILLLDEPIGGMNREEREDMVRYVLDVHDFWDVTVILVEHDMSIVMDISDRITVLNFGQKLVDGTPEEIQSHPEVIRAYLGDGVSAESSSNSVKE